MKAGLTALLMEDAKIFVINLITKLSGNMGVTTTLVGRLMRRAALPEHQPIGSVALPISAITPNPDKRTNGSNSRPVTRYQAYQQPRQRSQASQFGPCTHEVAACCRPICEEIFSPSKRALSRN